MTADQAADHGRHICGARGQLYAEAFAEREFVLGEASVAVPGKVFDAAALQHLVEASLDFQLTLLDVAAMTGTSTSCPRQGVRPLGDG